MSQSYKDAREEREAGDEEAWLSFLYADPICWLWPVPGDLDSLRGSHDRPLDEQIVEMALGPLPSDPDADARFLLARWQDGRCAICGHRRSLVDDHDHNTGMIRGQICQGCNVQEGIYGASDTLFGKYRERHPTRMLGLSARYWNTFTGAYAEATPPRGVEDKWTDAASEDIL